MSEKFLQHVVAVTPKSKRPGIVRKRKFDADFLSSRNNDCEGMIFD